jgi:tetratricopeptide (TPR) repeat protein
VKAEAIAREAGARAELARALFRRGWALFRMGQAKAVLDIGEQALALSEELEGRRDVAFSLKLLGIAHILAGEYSGAKKFQERALRLFEEMGDPWGVANILNNLGENARLQGDYINAVDIYEREMRILREIGNRDGEIICFNNLGAAKTALGRFAEAEADLMSAIRLSESLGNPALSETVRFLAEARLGLGNRPGASELAQQALELARRSGSPEDLGGALKVLGLVASASGPAQGADGRLMDAATCFEESIKAYEAAGAEAERFRTLREWGRHELEAGRRDRGVRQLREALGAFERLGLPFEVERTLRLLPS